MSRNFVVNTLELCLVAFLSCVIAGTNLAEQSPTSPTFLVSATSLQFNAAGAAIQPPAQKIFLASNLGSVSYEATAGYSGDSEGWLTVSPAIGATPSNLMVSADPRGLKPGTHAGFVAISSPSMNPVFVTVTLTVAD